MLVLIGGLDPTGGAGVLRDFATARRFAPGLSTRTVVSAWTRQGHGGPAELAFVGASAFSRQLDAIPSRVRAVKVGVLPHEGVASCCAWWERQGRPLLVVDPVLRASDGGELGRAAALEPLFARATLVTPNAPEAAAIGIDDWGQRFASALLLKGGHADDAAQVCDRLLVGDQTHAFARVRRAGPDVRGTGCALATAIAAGLARGEALVEAVATAIAWLDDVRGAAEAVDGDGVFLP